MRFYFYFFSVHSTNIPQHWLQCNVCVCVCIMRENRHTYIDDETDEGLNITLFIIRLYSI